LAQGVRHGGVETARHMRVSMGTVVEPKYLLIVGPTVVSEQTKKTHAICDHCGYKRAASAQNSLFFNF
jgi:hypothetical protein